jgi:hypothetical protein
MKLDQFRQSLSADQPPSGLSRALTALWHAGRGDHDTAHTMIQDEDGMDAAWVHAHVHRVEGDEDNAGYWYGRAGRQPIKSPLGEEWDLIAEALLTEGGL